MSTIMPLLVIISATTATPDADFGFDAVSVFNQMMDVIQANIGPIMALMGLMLGAGWVMKYFKQARKGK